MDTPNAGPPDENKSGAKAEEGANKSASASSEVSIRVDQGPPNQYTIHISHLERIGALLRGPTHTDYFRSLLLPFLVAFVTACFPYFVQYSTWLAAMNLQYASDRVDKGSSAYEKAATEIDQRWNATNLFFETANHLIELRQLDASRTSIYQAAVDLQTTRWAAYYSEIAAWKNNYNSLLAVIDHDLDQPVSTDLDLGSNGISKSKTAKFRCDNQKISLPDEAQRIGYQKYSLKAQFAIIGQCLDQVDMQFGLPVTIASSSLSKNDKDVIGKIIPNVQSMTNTFHCYADRRLQFFYQQKDDTTLTASHLMSRVAFGRRKYDKTKEDGCPT